MNITRAVTIHDARHACVNQTQDEMAIQYKDAKWWWGWNDWWATSRLMLTLTRCVGGSASEDDLLIGRTSVLSGI